MPYYFYPIFNAAPFLLSGFIWWTQRGNRGPLSDRRRAAFKTALVFNTFVSASLFVLVAWVTLVAFRLYPAVSGDVAYNRLVAAMIVLGLCSASLAFSGKGISRGLLVANGLFVSLLWWLLAGLGL